MTRIGAVLAPCLLLLLLSGCATDGVKKPSSQPKLLKKSQPVYPIVAYANHLTGYVQVVYDVNAQGKVEELRIVDSQPRYLFDEAVVRAMAQWEFEKNKPYKDMEIRVNFRLSQPNPPGQ
ncbi:protein TonB [Raoultella sp. BIGb0149]|uniref:TonB family protein n=1 Tax=Raoultella sp. BIGb0149 TaxID=2485116 RepID=UPI0010605BB5|nr:TonB family protein [Raoultella sp. BIGb0149]TDQ23090.1 protein TonB [Raoultella sp. BIGb0149]